MVEIIQASKPRNRKRSDLVERLTKERDELLNLSRQLFNELYNRNGLMDMQLYIKAKEILNGHK